METTTQTTAGLIRKAAESYLAKEEIPMGYVPGFPILSIVNDMLVMSVPFLRYKVTGEKDKTLVYPIRYVIDLNLPDGRIVGFNDLAYLPEFASLNFGSACGLFRHKAIADLDRNQYAALKAAVFADYDRVIAALLDEAPYTAEDDAEMRAHLQRIVEPSLKPIYEVLDPDFYNKYITER
ncbi:MAG: hypothetical protein NC336_04475 [Clostridium sp.]|nr:hypothetical protein [Clostridium sp.]